MGTQKHPGIAYQPGSVGISFEVYPPKSVASTQALYRVVEELARWKPLFLSVTYGAGGSTRSQSLEILAEFKRRSRIPLTAHFTCVGSTKTQIKEWLEQASQLGVENIMALRGDPPVGQDRFVPTEGGFSHGSELVHFIRSEKFPFGIGVAGYPEAHKESASAEEDLRWLKHKVDQGADAIYTQLFYKNQDFYAFREKCVAAGIKVPIIPGILPVVSLDQVRRITKLCGATLPPGLAAQLEACQGNAARQLEVGIRFATQQCEDLLKQDCPGIHFYVLNRSDMIEKILANLGMNP